MENHINLKVRDVIRDKIEGDEWKVTDVKKFAFDAVCIKGSENWEVGSIETWSHSFFDSTFEIVSSQSTTVNHPPHYGGNLKVGDIVRDKAEGDEWEVKEINEHSFDAICIKGFGFWNIGQSKNFSLNFFDICFEIVQPQSTHVNHPTHYGGADNPYEAIKVIEAWDLNFCLGNAVKYISRAGKKDSSKTAEDLEKAIWYLNRELNKLRDANTK